MGSENGAYPPNDNFNAKNCDNILELGVPHFQTQPVQSNWNYIFFAGRLVDLSVWFHLYIVRERDPTNTHLYPFVISPVNVTMVVRTLGYKEINKTYDGDKW